MSILQKRGTLDWLVPEAQLEELIENAHKAAHELGIRPQPVLEGQPTQRPPAMGECCSIDQ